MPSTLKPASLAELKDAVAWAVSAKAPLEIIGSGTKRRIGRPVEAAWLLDVSAMAGITLYEPEELIIRAHAGTPLDELKAVLQAHGQQLAFDPPDLSLLLGSQGDPGHNASGTLGGMVASNLAGPARIKMGGVRDHVLGFKAVSGRGEAFKGGGRVVKNVTGYDLPKLMAGSWGTLAVLAEVTLKVLPRPEAEATLAIPGLADDEGVACLARGLGSPCEVAGAAHVPADLAQAFPLAMRGGLSEPLTVLRLEGFRPSVDYRLRKLRDRVARGRPSLVLGADDSADLWREIRDCSLLAGAPERAVWRISVAPSNGPAVLARLRQSAGARGFYDWGGGLIWCDVPAAPDAQARAVRAAVAGKGHATLIRAPREIRAALDVFDPLSPGVAALTARIKASFDPYGILNPGRMYRIE
ncbi:glycolate oxidase subunit GlcE [Rhodoligotrophos defluvii]|uniref:glycolate oxidase subunit GlcE n=1 Tax=Rhodoligotrophos defluvii TaxID=2561934 RepID=UPI0010C9D3C2|nr:glycolate oxidase subunit GlcE [Rhodoligotrophos defluvii]